MSDSATSRDAREFGLHMKQGGWRLGLLVARNVSKGTNHGGDRKSDQRNDRSVDRKVSVKEFARQAGTSHPRVSRHLDAWNRAADAGHVPHASELTPGVDPDLDWDSLPAWGNFYDASKAGGYNGGKDRDVSDQTIVNVLSTAPMEQVERVLEKLPKERQEQIAAATGDSYMQAKREAVERRSRMTDEERQADWEATERLNEIQRNLFGQEEALSIRINLLNAAETLERMIERGTLTPKAARLIEIDNDEWQQKLIDAQEHITEDDE
jgi:hypothetical protein